MNGPKYNPLIKNGLYLVHFDGGEWRTTAVDIAEAQWKIWQRSGSTMTYAEAVREMQVETIREPVRKYP